MVTHPSFWRAEGTCVSGVSTRDGLPSVGGIAAKCYRAPVRGDHSANTETVPSGLPDLGICRRGRLRSASMRHSVRSCRRDELEDIGGVDRA
jgi:hypothetical protein